MGVFGFGVVLAPAVGPSIGGLLVEQFGWRSIFFVVLPFGALALALAQRLFRLHPPPALGPTSTRGGSTAPASGSSRDQGARAAERPRALSRPRPRDRCRAAHRRGRHAGRFRRCASGGCARCWTAARAAPKVPHRGRPSPSSTGWDCSARPTWFRFSCRPHCTSRRSQAGAALLPAGLVLAGHDPFRRKARRSHSAAPIGRLGLGLPAASFALMTTVSTGTPLWVLIAWMVVSRIGLGLVLPSLSLAPCEDCRRPRLRKAPAGSVSLARSAARSGSVSSASCSNGGCARMWRRRSPPSTKPSRSSAPSPPAHPRRLAHGAGAPADRDPDLCPS